MDDAFAIKIGVGDGRYSTGKDTVKPSKHGKAWASRAALKNHLRMVATAGIPGGLYRQRYGDNCEVIEARDTGIYKTKLAEWVEAFMGVGT